MSFCKKAFFGVLSLCIAGGIYAFVRFDGGQYVSEKTAAFFEKTVLDNGIKLNHIIVEGRHNASTQDISKTLAARKGMNLFDLDVHVLRERLVGLSWVRSAIVQRRFPDTLYVRLTERRPVAQWQNKGSVSLIDDQGKQIEGVSSTKYQKLLSVSGEEAPKHAPEIVSKLQTVPAVRARLHGAVLNGGRHWDLLVRNGPRIKLPELEVNQALLYLQGLLEKGHLDNPKIKSIDIRLQDRTFFYLEEGEAKKHQQSFKNRGKAHAPSK